MSVQIWLEPVSDRASHRDTKPGDRIELHEGREVSIGRGSESGVVLFRDKIACRHCVTSQHDEVAVVQDTRSRHGIFVNGLHLGRATLAAGNLVNIGGVFEDIVRENHSELADTY